MHHEKVWLTMNLRRLALMASVSLFLLACPDSDKSSAVGDLRPRRDEPLRKLLPPEKKPLIGLFVDAASKATSPDGKSWATAFPTIMAAVNASMGQNIYVATGTYKRPRIDLHDKENIRLFGGYKAGDRYEKENFEIAPDAWVTLDGDGAGHPLVRITGNSKKISFLGGFVFKNVAGDSAVVIEGAGVANRIKEISFVSSRFENNDNNVPGADGGGMRIRFAEDLMLEGVDAINNRTSQHGGFLYLESVRELTIKRGVWDGNIAGASGGALYSRDAERMKLTGQDVRGNQAQEGAGIFVQNHHNQEITDINFEGNTSTAFGAGMSIRTSDNLAISRVRFSGHSVVGGAGAAVYVNGGSALSLNLDENEIKNNHAQTGGAFDFNNVDGVTVNGGKFSGNRATLNGGTMNFISSKNITISKSAIDDSSGAEGGALKLEQPGLQVLLSNVSVKDARATSRGGAIDLEGADAAAPTVTIKDSKFEDCTSVGNGGAIFTTDISYKVTIEGTLFKNNRTQNYGGALALDGKTHAAAKFVVGVGTQFIDNHSDQDFGGGAILAVFDIARAVAPMPNAEDRQLVFYNTKADLQGNRANGLNGNILRVTGHDVDRTPTLPLFPISNPVPPAARDFIQVVVVGSPETKLNYFIAYSTVAHHTDSWDRLLLDWEGSTTEVYAW